jgi:hypothetical protein
MKKFVISMLLVLSVMSVVFANGGKEIDFDPAPTKFEGEWRNAHEKYSDQVYVFSGNRWKYTCNDESKWGSGYFTFTKDTITLYKEDGKKWWHGRHNSNPIFEMHNAMFYLIWNNNDWGAFLKQPVEFVTNGEIFLKFEGIWKNVSSKFESTYTFSGNQFVFIGKNGYTIKGTFEITNNGLLKLITPEGAALLPFSFQTDGTIILNHISSSFYIIWGTFNKQ